VDLERQRVYTWARKGRINDDDMDRQLAAIWIEESELKRELNDKRHLLGDRAKRLLEVAKIYRERVIAGVRVNFDPQTPEEKHALFEWRRKVVQGIVKRIEVATDKSISKVQIELNFDDLLQDGVMDQGDVSPVLLPDYTRHV
jgi:hypothetical protein